MMNILVIGAGGQIGTELIPHLQKTYGDNKIIAADLREDIVKKLSQNCRAITADATDIKAYGEVVSKYKIGRVYNLVALLSATGEKNPLLAWKINMGALMNSLELAKEYKFSLFTPSSIGAFGNSTPKVKTPQDTLMRPNTMYGVCKVSGELLGDYYFSRFGVDTRSVRFPGIISSGALPGGGTTDYAVEVFYEVIKNGTYCCPVPENSFMDMLYMPDALEACTNLMDADPGKLIHRNSFNVTSMSFSPSVLFKEIKKHMPQALFTYDIDPVKAAIAASWPDSLDDSSARAEWGWKPKWGLEEMVKDMLKAVRAKF
ncbi:MAG: NAD-dependent epimerase/dehydratase family protein [Bacteroidales bacterium]|nr:NAD-dependent epimerase/dehydratase family protein [Bacteroidales bacterium]MDD3989222.1 NAD-dependent epimerase/dehydratase family protein [Bacteroidales bacterium]